MSAIQNFSSKTLDLINRYQKHFTDWDNFSTVRVKPHSYKMNFDDLAKKELREKKWFIPQGVQILSHPLLANLDQDRTQYILGRFLLQFLEYGVLMEHEFVNASLAEIALGENGINLPEVMRLDAFKIYTDEGYHACFTLEAAQHIREYIGLPNTAWPLKNSRLEGLRKLIADAPAEDRSLIRFGIVAISETVAAKELTESMQNVVIDPIVNLFVDHAHDETKHCMYFSVLFEVVWEQLSEAERLRLGAYLPKILKAFVNINVYALQDTLSEIQIDKETANKIIQDSYPPDFAIKRALGVATVSFTVMRKIGIFRNPLIREAFIKEGFPEKVCQ